MSYNRPSIIVTPSTPIPTSDPKIFSTQQREFSSFHHHLSPRSYLEGEEEDGSTTTTIRKIQRRVQLVVAILALFLSAAAFASIVHPSFVSNPISYGIEKHQGGGGGAGGAGGGGLFSSLRVNFDDHELRSIDKKKSQPRNIRRQKREWKLAKMPKGSVEDIDDSSIEQSSQKEIEVQNLVIATTTTTAATTATAETEQSTSIPIPQPPPQLVDSLRLKSTRVVQAQLMKEARERIEARKRRLGDRLVGGGN